MIIKKCPVCGVMFRTYSDKNCSRKCYYNSMKGLKQPEEQKKNHSKFMKQWYKDNPKAAIEKNKKMADTLRGRPLTKEHAEKISEALTGKKKSKEHIDKIIKTRKGYTHSKETRKKLSSSTTKLWKDKNYRESQTEKIVKTTNSNKHRAILKEKRKLQITPVKDTTIEIKIQNFLEELKIYFEKHKYMSIPHGYQCDIFIPSMNMIIECDGDYWHNYPHGTKKDHFRTKELIARGYNVLRIWECDIRKMTLYTFKTLLKGGIKNE